MHFAGETGKDGPNSEWAEHWDNHFSFFKSHPDLISLFPSILKLDIWMRKEYNVCLSNTLPLITMKNTLKQFLTTALNRLKTHPSTPSHCYQPHLTPLHPTHPNLLLPSNSNNLSKTNPCPFAKAPVATLQLLHASSAETKDTHSLHAHCKHVAYYSPANIHIYSLLAEQLCCSVMSLLV